MFCGKISLLNISASQLPWSNENKTDQRSDLRPYLAISVDAEHRINVGQEEISQVSFTHYTIFSVLFYRNKNLPEILIGVTKLLKSMILKIMNSSSSLYITILKTSPTYLWHIWTLILQP